jgi:hypothetical protein
VDFDEFVREIMDVLPEYLPAYNIEEIRTQPVVKNNGVSLMGLMIIVNGESAAPNVYIDYYYSLYKDGKPLDQIMCDIAADYEEARKRLSVCDTDKFNPINMKNNVYMVLVNYEKNKEKLENCPYIPFLDLAVMFRYVVSDDNNCIASGLVRNEEQELWGASTEELYELSVKNMKEKFPMSLMKLTDKMQELRHDEGFIPECNLYVMTNNLNVNGAIYMTYQVELEKFAESQASNFYIIPSSVHEILLYPDDKSLTKEQMQELVSDVNRYVLSDVEYLSDSVYYYDRASKTITY